MSHTTNIGEFFIVHNGDYSGDVQIGIRDGMKDGVPSYKNIASVPMWLLERIVANKVRDQRIARLETMGPKELLGLNLDALDSQSVMD